MARTLVRLVGFSLVVLVLLSIAGTASATTQRGVQATPYNQTSHPWSTDGCSWVPDRGTHTVILPYRIPVSAWWDFHHACIHHDGCYKKHWASRATCDQWFRNDMNASCAALHPRDATRREVCQGKATQYYVGVRALGGPAYNGWSHYIPFV